MTCSKQPISTPLVCVVDDDESVRRGLSRLFRSAHLPAETFSSAKAYLDRAPYDGPACLVLDLRMPGIDGLELQESLPHQEQVVFLTGHGDVPSCVGAMRRGAVDYLTKPVDHDELLEAVNRALARSAQLRHAAAERLHVRSRLQTLTPREFEVMKWVVAGRLNKQIADEFGAAEKTIKIHRGRVMEKMGVVCVADLVRASQVAGVAPEASSPGPSP